MQLQRFSSSCQQSFVMESNAPFLALIEDMQGILDDTPDNTSHGNSYDPPRLHSRMGRMLKLPCEAQMGAWTAHLQPPPQDKSKDGYPMVLCHQSRMSLGPLRQSKDVNDTTTSSYSAGLEEDVTVLAIHPLLN
jgi:hypothetical protein